MIESGKKSINILGIRGIPAAHGGFETFAAKLAPYLRDKGWKVSVYCQIEPDSDGLLQPDFEDVWHGIHRIHIGVSGSSSSASVLFDWKCIRDVLKRPGIDLVLGYNTAIFTILQTLYGRRVLMNMDGIEWKRGKWSLPIKMWFYLNEFVGFNACWMPIADHPEIKRHLKRHGFRQPIIIPYGADRVERADSRLVKDLGVEPDEYLICIARIEPENSILEFVRAFSARPRLIKLLVLGRFDESSSYHAAVRAAASADVIFPGAIYDPTIVSALRFHARAYLHGHQVGGTNPSLVEALGAGNAVIAHDNLFNRWVAGEDQFYFKNEFELNNIYNEIETSPERLMSARGSANMRYEAEFTWQKVLKSYENLFQLAISGR